MIWAIGAIIPAVMQLRGSLHLSPPADSSSLAAAQEIRDDLMQLGMLVAHADDGAAILAFADASAGFS